MLTETFLIYLTDIRWDNHIQSHYSSSRPYGYNNNDIANKPSDAKGVQTGQARSRGGGGQGGQLTPLENQRSTFWNLAHEIIKANNYKWLTIYLHQLLCIKPPTKWLQNLLSKGGSGGANLWLCRVAVTRVPHTPSADPPP